MHACAAIMEQVWLRINDYDDVYVLHNTVKEVYELNARWNFSGGGPRVLKEYSYLFILSHSANQIIDDMINVRDLELL